MTGEHRLHVRVSPEAYARATAYAESRGTTVSAIVRGVVDDLATGAPPQTVALDDATIERIAEAVAERLREGGR